MCASGFPRETTIESGITVHCAYPIFLAKHRVDNGHPIFLGKHRVDNGFWGNNSPFSDSLVFPSLFVPVWFWILLNPFCFGILHFGLDLFRIIPFWFWIIPLWFWINQDTTASHIACLAGAPGPATSDEGCIVNLSYGPFKTGCMIFSARRGDLPRLKCS